MARKRIDLAGVFGRVAETLAQNQQTLNRADEYNQDHGTNMAQTFQTITAALQEKKGASASTALRYASKQLAKNTSSGSGKLYAENLAQAAAQFKGKTVDEKGAMQLLQTLIGSGQTAGQSSAQSASGGDALSAILGGLTGNETPQPSSSQAGGDLMSTLLGGLTGGESSSAGLQDGLDMQDVLSAGMAFFQARQRGDSSMEALVQALVTGSGMGNTHDREQSTQLVVNSFLQALSSLAGKS